MADRQIQGGTQGNILRFKIFDSAVTTRAGKTGLAYNTSGIVISTIADTEATATTLTAQTVATLGAFVEPGNTKASFKEVDATNHPGIYELHLPSGRLGVSGAKQLLVSISGMSGAAQMDLIVELQAAVARRGLWG